MTRLAVVSTDDRMGPALVQRMRWVQLVPLAEAEAIVVLSPERFDDSLRRSGKPLLLCAPASSLADFDQLSQQLSSMLVIGNPDCYLSSRRLIKEHLIAGKLGTAGLVRLHRWSAATSDRGALLRDLHLICWLMARPVTRVYSLGIGDGSSLQIHLGFRDGGMALLEHAHVPNGQAYQSLMVLGSSGAAYADDLRNSQLIFQEGHPRSVLTGEGDGHLAVLIQEFLAHLVDRREMGVSHAPWRNALLLAEAAERSRVSSQAVTLEGTAA